LQLSSSFTEKRDMTLLPQFIRLPGGPFVMGSAAMGDSRWVHLSGYELGESPPTEGQYRNVTGRPGDEKASEDHLVTHVSWNDAMNFINQLKPRYGINAHLPTEVEWEFAARGPAVNLREAMEAEGIAVDDFADWVRNRFENFVEQLEMGATIFTDPANEELQGILKTKNSLYAWRVFPTTTGRFEDWEILKSFREKQRMTEANLRSVNDYGLKIGGVGLGQGLYEWVERVGHDEPDFDDEYKGIRGRSCLLGFPNDHWVAGRGFMLSGVCGRLFSFRLAAPLSS
jgi:sulfatase-modifying factor enzyme 1